MGTRINKAFCKFIIFACAFCVFTACSFASVNSLSGIDVRPNESGSYDITFKLDKFAKIQKFNSEKDNLTLLINSTIPSDYVEIVYDNANNLDNVIVQKKNKNNTVVLLQGKNIENSEIITNELSTGIVKEINAGQGLFYTADKKLTASLFGAILFLFALMLSLRKKNSHINTNRKIQTASNKTEIHTRTIPSINYRINKTYKTANMSVPKDFVINKYTNEVQEKIRKAG